MIQTRPQEFMVSYTPQRQWIEKGGIKFRLTFFFIEVGAGTFFVASLLDNLEAAWTEWLLCAVLGGGLHPFYLSRPLRFWRMAFSSGWKTWWISRGISFVALFFLLALIHMALLQWLSRVTVLIVLADILALLTIIYGGFAMDFVNGIPLWNTALLPVICAVSGLWGGAELTLGIAVRGGAPEMGAAIEKWIRLLLVAYLILIPVYLISVRYTSSLGKITVRHMVAMRWATFFWGVAVILGMAIPLAAVIMSVVVGFQIAGMLFLHAPILCGLLGDLAIRYLILKCGLYAPLIPSTISA